MLSWARRQLCSFHSFYTYLRTCVDHARHGLRCVGRGCVRVPAVSDLTRLVTEFSEGFLSSVLVWSQTGQTLHVMFDGPFTDGVTARFEERTCIMNRVLWPSVSCVLS